MKKLLGILGTITIVGSGMSGIVGNAPVSAKNKINDLQINNLEKLIRIKRNLNSQKTATKIGGVGIFAKTTNLNIVVDSKDNAYFGNDTGAYVLKEGETTATKIGGVGIFAKTTNLNIVVDSKDNAYFGNDTGAYVLKEGETTATKIGGVGTWYSTTYTKIFFDKNDKIYITNNTGAYVLKEGETTAKKITNVNNNFTKTNIVDSRGNIYSIKNYFRPYILKQGETTATKIGGVGTFAKTTNLNIVVDSKDNVYFGNDTGAYVLKSTELLKTNPTATKIDGVGTFAKTTNLNIVVDSKDNVYFGNDTGAYVLKIKYDKKIKFLGFYDKYKGEFGLDTDNKKILFFGKNEEFHSWLQEREQSKIYNKIIIKTIDNQIIKEIVINVGDSMRGIINKYNLKNGINYENGYVIEIWSYEPWRTQFYENNSWEYLTKDGSLDRTINNLDQKFIIVNNEIMSYKFIKQHFSLLNDWIKNYDTWIIEINRQEKEDVPSFTIEQKRTWKDDKKFQLRQQIYSYKQTIHILINQENIKNLYTKLQNLENTLKNLENRIKEIENKLNANGCLNNMIDNIRDGAVAGTIGTLFGGGILAGPIGIITGAITGLVNNITC